MKTRSPIETARRLHLPRLSLHGWMARFAFLAVISSPAIADTPAARDLTADERTIFLLETDSTTGAFRDRIGKHLPMVTGGTFESDPVWGRCLRLGDGDKNSISLKDDGRFNFKEGMTLDAWLWLDEPLPAKGASLALKVGSFAWDLSKGKLNTAWMVFPREDIATTSPLQFNYFPVGGDMINGFMDVPLKKWTRLTMSYDEALGRVTTCINGMTDRQRYRYRGPEPLQCDARSSFTLFEGLKNCRIGAVRLNSGRPRLAAPSMEVFVSALPYEGKVQITFDHIDPDLPLPIEVVMVWEKASGSAETVRTILLESHAKRDEVLDTPTWKDSLHTVSVNANAGGRAVFAKSFRVANVKPTGATLLHPDHTISKDGKKFFPLLMYHVMPEDFAQVADLGFNIVYNSFNLSRHATGGKEGYDRLLSQSLDAAQNNHLYLITATDATFNHLHTIPVARNHPAMLLWYGADEPWGDLTRLTESYNTIKMLEPNLPVLIVQNNYSRLQDTAPGADILATDPYPVPNVSLRAVADATQACIRATSGRKPVWTVIPQYLGKIPSREELRCMAWLAIASGANGLGFFDWDERTRDSRSSPLKGWYTREHPDQVADLRSVVSELRGAESILLVPNAVYQPKIVNPALHVIVKEAQGKRWLIVASDSRRKEAGVIEFPEAFDALGKRLGSDGELRIVGGKAELETPPLGAGIYEMIGF